MNHRRARLCVSVLATVLIGASITTAGAATPAARAHEDGASATQRIDVSAPGARRSGTVEVTVGALEGTYEGKPSERRYGLTVHTDDSPSGVTVQDERLAKAASAARLEAAESGWYYDAPTGVVHVKTAEAPTTAALKVRITGTASVGGKHPEDRDVRLDASTPAIASIGEAQQVTTSFTNSTGKPVRVTGTTLTAPEGWTVKAAGPTTAEELEEGKTFTARFTVTASENAQPGSFEIGASTSYATRNAAYTVGSRTGTTLAHASVAAAADNVGVTAADNPQPGDIDGGGSSFIAERLAEAGVSPGATVKANGFTFTWPGAEPGTPDNTTGKGQTVRVTGTEKGNALAFLGTGTSGTADGTVTVHYGDGSTTEATLGFPNWCCLPTDRYGAKIAVSIKGKNTRSGPSYPTVDYRLYTKTVRIDPLKQVAAVSLPDNGAVHVFAMSVGHEQVVPAPVPDGQYALANGTESGLLLEAPGDTNAGRLRVGEPSASPSQKWNVTRNDDGSYQLRNAGSGLCADVAGSSGTSGAQVVQYTCTGTPNQNWLVTDDSGALTIRARHSGLSLAATAGGLVVQATDSGAAAQRWRAKAA
ncbi:RICIN domain-containing protein [Streptomyces xantholiticus]